jgi:hypothetical protein
MARGAITIAIRTRTNARSWTSLTNSIVSLFPSLGLTLRVSERHSPSGFPSLLSLSILDRSSLIGTLSGMLREFFCYLDRYSSLSNASRNFCRLSGINSLIMRYKMLKENHLTCHIRFLPAKARLVHRLISSWHMVAFKMGRRQGARRAHIC